MNTGYSYDEKVLKGENVSDEEYALISENLTDLKGVGTKLDWERTYPYWFSLQNHSWKRIQ